MRAFLSRHLGHPPEALELVGEGTWSRCYGFVDQGRELVIRFGRHVEDFRKDRRAHRFRGAALPVPEVLEIGETTGACFAISRRARGTAIETLAPAEWVVTLPSLLGTLDALREADVSDATGFGAWDATGRGPHGSWRDFLLAVAEDTPAMRTHGWRQRLDEAPRSAQIFETGLERLRGVADAAADVRCLVHADLINGNVLSREGRIEAVLDWGCSLYGDFVYDVAWLDFWAPYHEALATNDFLEAAMQHWTRTGLRVPDLEARLRACRLHIGLDHLAFNAFARNASALQAVTQQLRALID